MSVLLFAFSVLDLRVSELFYRGGFLSARHGWAGVLHFSIPWIIAASLTSVGAIYILNRATGRRTWGIDGRKVVYLVLVLVLGAGLVVNAVLKDHFGRARPRDVAEFGGPLDFTPAFVISSECDHNCSFVSGDAAGAFFGLAFAFAWGRRRPAVAAALGFGALVSVSRIATGAHWFSDTVVSFFVMLIVADALHYWMFEFSAAPAGPVPEVKREALAEA